MSARAMASARALDRIARTDSTFTRQGRSWVGKCLICGGALRFDAASGEGADVEHIVPRSLGGSHDLRNLGITHRRCNAEKGRNWDGGRRRRRDPERYQTMVERLLAERGRRWREPEREGSA